MLRRLTNSAMTIQCKIIAPTPRTKKMLIKFLDYLSVLLVKVNRCHSADASIEELRESVEILQPVLHTNAIFAIPRCRQATNP